MRVRMKRSMRGAVDPMGLVVELHEAGQEYDLPDALAEVYVKHGFAVRVAPERKVIEEPEATAEVPRRKVRKARR